MKTEKNDDGDNCQVCNETHHFCWMQAHQRVNPFANAAAVDSFRIHPAQFIAFFTCFHPIIIESMATVSTFNIIIITICVVVMSHPIVRHHHSRGTWEKENKWIFPFVCCTFTEYEYDLSANSIILSRALIYLYIAIARTRTSHTNTHRTYRTEQNRTECNAAQHKWHIRLAENENIIDAVACDKRRKTIHL